LAPGSTRRERLHAAFQQLHQRGDELVTELWNELQQIQRVRLYGPPPGTARTPTIAFTMDEMPSIEVAKKLYERGFLLSHDDFYDMQVVDHLVKERSEMYRHSVVVFS